MAWPKNTDYHEAIQNPLTSLHDEELRGGEVASNALGLPMLWSGGFADVYKVYCPATGNTWAVKCFTREVRHLQERYRSIAEHLELARLPFTVDFQYLDQGIRISGAWFPVLKMRWVEGLTLDQFVKEHLDRPKNLKMLLDLWVKLAARLRDAHIAHADLQHGNVLLVPMDRGALGLRLIDYDGMYIPSLAGTRSGELGHSAYQHPQRLREKIYNGEVDRFSHLVIYTSVRCLSIGGRESWQKFNNGDNLLFREVDFAAPGNSPVFRAFWQSGDREVRTLVGRLALACGQRLEEVPWLDRVVDKGLAVPLTQTEEKEVNARLAVSVQVPVAQAVPQTVAQAVPQTVAYALGGSRPAGMPPLPVAAVVLSTAVVPVATLTGTAPVTAAGTVPRMDGLGSPSYNAAVAGTVLGEAMKLPSPSGRGARGEGFLLWPLRKFDRLLSALVGPENAILHNFLRVVSVVALLAMVFLAAPIVFRSAPPQSVPQASRAVYRIQIDPPGAKLAATGMGVSIEGDGAVRTVTVASPDGRRELVLMAMLDGYETLNRSLVPRAGESDTLLLWLQPLPDSKNVTRPIPALVALPEKTESPKPEPPKSELSLMSERVDLGGGVKMDLVLIPAGFFTMGDASEKPVHRVTITQPFYIGKYKVTQEQWETIMGGNPSKFREPKNPVEQVSWYDCQTFIGKLNAKVGGQGRMFALPTEAQWEYACRAGSTGKFCFGDEEARLGDYAWYTANSGSKTHPVGEKKPNAWGLYDMHGNVGEWCADWYGTYGAEAVDDPSGPITGISRVFRGGSWGRDGRDCQSAYRGPLLPGDRYGSLGLRVARVPADTGDKPRLTEHLKIQPILPQTVEAGKRLQLAVTLENHDAWQGKLRHGLAGQPPPGAEINPQSGEFSWTPPLAEPAGQQEISVYVTSREGQTTWTSFSITVTRPIPTKPPKPEPSPPSEKVDLGSGVKLDMVLIPAGSFTMGDHNEKPPHKVTITKPFCLGKYEVTQEQWEAVMGSNPSRFKGPKNPVEQVSWDDCQQFLVKLNAKTGGRGGKFVLPTEAQWEYVCRAGSTGKFCFGDDEKQLGDYAWYTANSGSKTHPVGEKKPNAFGLYDMHGNVWEWCQDRHGAYGAKTVTDPSGPTTGSDRVVRGGCWSDYARGCRSAYRSGYTPEDRGSNLGFRVSQVPAD